MLVLWRRPTSAFDHDRCLRYEVVLLHVSDMFVTDRFSGVKKFALLAFLNFGFAWQMKDFVSGDARQS